MLDHKGIPVQGGFRHKPLYQSWRTRFKERFHCETRKPQRGKTYGESCSFYPWITVIFALFSVEM